jgi:hypothetical protein
MLIAAGENFKYVSRHLGHANILITRNTYGHLLKEASTGGMARLAMRIPGAEATSNVTGIAAAG